LVSSWDDGVKNINGNYWGTFTGMVSKEIEVQGNALGPEKHPLEEGLAIHKMHACA
jgi:hypothetical protein